MAFLRPPLLCPTIESLSFCISRPIMGGYYTFHHHALVGGSTILRAAPQFLPNLRHLRIDGDDSIEEFESDIALFCSCLRTLETLVITPWALTDELLSTLSLLPSLLSIRVLESGKERNMLPAQSSPMLSSAPVPELSRGAFPALKDAGLIAWSPALATVLICQPYFPSSHLRTLWLKFSTVCIISPTEVRTLLRALVWTFPVLEELTLRFGSYGWNGQTPHGTHYEPLSYFHIQSFFLIRNLNVFCFDHTMPLHISNAEIRDMARHCSRFRRLILNPYPTVPSADVVAEVPTVEALGYFAESCPRLEKLGLLMCTRERPTSRPPAKFSRLFELFVGWSVIPVFDGTSEVLGVWDDVASYLSLVMDDSTKLGTVYGYGPREDLGELVSASMRARCQVPSDFDPYYRDMALAWSSVWAIASLKRATG